MVGVFFAQTRSTSDNRKESMFSADVYALLLAEPNKDTRLGLQQQYTVEGLLPKKATRRCCKISRVECKHILQQKAPYRS